MIVRVIMRKGVVSEMNFVFKRKDEKVYGALIIVHTDKPEFAWFVLSTIVKDVNEFVLLDISITLKM